LRGISQERGRKDKCEMKTDSNAISADPCLSRPRRNMSVLRGGPNPAEAVFQTRHWKTDVYQPRVRGRADNRPKRQGQHIPRACIRRRRVLFVVEEEFLSF
jgi:hypothetical protein